MTIYAPESRVTRPLPSTASPSRLLLLMCVLLSVSIMAPKHSATSSSSELPPRETTAQDPDPLKEVDH